MRHGESGTRRDGSVRADALRRQRRRSQSARTVVGEGCSLPRKVRWRSAAVSARFSGRIRRRVVGTGGTPRVGLVQRALWEPAPHIADSRYVVNAYFYNEFKMRSLNEINRLPFGHWVPRRIRGRRKRRFAQQESEQAEQIHALAAFDRPLRSRRENGAARAIRAR